MSGPRRLVTTLLSAAVFFAGSAQAMEIQQFDKMAFSDRKEYVLDLVDGAQKVLRDGGHADLAEQVGRLFTTKDPQTNVSVGVAEFEVLLARARVADLERLKKDPGTTRLEVEHAMIMTLKKNGIDLPPSFMHVADKFRPKLLPKN